MKRTIAALLALLLLAGAGGASALAAEPEPLQPVSASSSEMAGASSEEPLPLVSGTYESEDGSVLTVKADGTASYETLVSGTVNGRPMSGRLTFTGKLENGAFSFDRVRFFMLDLTDTAASLGYTSASLWEAEAEALYRASLPADAASGEASPEPA